MTHTPLPKSLRILSYNIQAGLTQEHMHQYLTRGWRHLLPHRQRMENLEEISRILSDFDLVAIQEIDPGSLRSGYINQIEFLAKRAHFPYWYFQVNRNLGRVAKFCNAVLSRFLPYKVEQHKLPGVLPGRGAIRLFYGDPEKPLVVIMVHLSLGPVSQRLQMDYIYELIKGFDQVILMGDLNCQLEKLLNSTLLADEKMRPVNYLYNTYPSWKPQRILDHILVSSSIQVSKVKVLDLPYSDHLPVAMEIHLGD